VRKNIDGFENYIIDSDGYVISKERYITESRSGKVYKLRERVLKPPEIYKLFPNVHRATIHDVLSEKTWKHITNY